MFPPLTRVKSLHQDMPLNEKRLFGQMEMELFSKGDYFPSVLPTGWWKLCHSQASGEALFK